MSSLRLIYGSILTIGIMVAANVGYGRLMLVLDSNHHIGLSASDDPLSRRPHDVVFLGDSRTHQGMDPNTFNRALTAAGHHTVDAYNLGRPGMQSPFFYLVLRRYLRDSRAPRTTVFLNTSFYLLKDAGWLQDVYLNYYTPDLTTAWDAYASGLLSPTEAFAWYLGTRVPMYRHRKRAKTILDGLYADPGKLIAELQSLHRTIRIRTELINGRKIDAALSPDEKSTFAHFNNGYVSRGFAAITPADIVPQDYKPAEETELMISFLRKTFELANSGAIDLIIYEFPFPAESCTTRLKEVVAYYQARLRNIAAGLENIRFVDNDYCWPIEYFVDQLHVNQRGAERLSAEAAGWLRTKEPNRAVHTSIDAKTEQH